MAGFVGYNADNHVTQIDIYTNNEDNVRTIVGNINAIWDDGIIPHLNFAKLKKKFKVNREDIINAWNSYL